MDKLMIMTLRIALGVVGLALFIGCASRPKPQAAAKPPPATRPVVTGAPLIDIARGGAGLPLDGAAALSSRDTFIQALRKGYDRRIALDDSVPWISMAGPDHRRMEQLKIDLTNQTVRDDYKPTLYEKPGEPQPGIRARQFEYVAWPLLYRNGATRWRISATDARFSLLHDKSGRDTLILSEATEGSFDFSVNVADLKPMLLNFGASRSSPGFSLKDIEFDLSSDNPRSLEIDMRVSAMVLFVPTTVRMHARMDVDEWCNVKLSEVSCTGEDPGGAVVAALAEPSLQKQKDQLRPLVKWPGDRMVVKDVQITVDEALTIRATFGRE